MNEVALGTPSTSSLASPVARVHPSIAAEAFRGQYPSFRERQHGPLVACDLCYTGTALPLHPLLVDLARSVTQPRFLRPLDAPPLRVRSRMGDVAAPAAEPEAVLPNWLEEMMEPGVGAGVFLTLKLALIGLVATLCLMLSFAEDLTIRFHLKVFLGLASVLTVIVIWFISELKKDADGACGKAPKDAGAKKAQ